MVLDYIDYVAKNDREVGEAIRSEYQRQCDNIELIASENIVSEAVLVAMGSVLTNKYAEGYPGKRYYGGCQCVPRPIMQSIWPCASPGIQCWG